MILQTKEMTNTKARPCCAWPERAGDGSVGWPAFPLAGQFTVPRAGLHYSSQ